MEAQNCGGEGTTASACERNGQMDGCQLVGAPMMVSGGDGASASVELVVRALVKVEDSVVGSCGKRKRGRPPRGQAKPQPVKKEEEEEDVCFICFDGGSLVLCDRRGCPKAYHPACIKRDEAFFQSKAKWNCGWHICSNCQKASHYMCYTCTYSLCKACAKDADYLCVRENKGFCATCMRTVMLIENNTPGNKDMAQVDFDDKSSWEYLFKVYWFYLKGKLSLTLDELTQAKNPWKAAGTITCKEPLLDLFCGSSDGKSSNSDIPPGHMDVTDSKRIRSKGRLILPNNEDSQSTDKSSSDKSTTSSGSPDWASIELLEFVSHMKNGDISMLPQFDVQGLLLEYIKRNNLRDPRRKSQIICDSRLITLFGRPRVGHFEMLKLLEYHFLIKENNQKDIILSNAVRAVPNQVEGGGNNENLLTIDKEKKRKTRKKGEERGPQTNLDEYAAIDIHNINLIYLRRRLMESLIMDNGKFHDKVVGSIVRIRISICDPKQDMYRLVQVVGTFKAAVPYKLGEKTVDVMLEILNLDKKETVAVDAISNQEFSEDECRRLRQSIKCGLVKRLTVGQVQEKARALQEVRLNDWLETEMLRLNHLRDRASEKGRKKELRECVEKIELLKTPEERQRRLNENPEVHADPKMDPNCESDEDSGEVSKKKPAEHAKQRYSGFRKYGKESNSPQNKSTPTKFNLDKGASSRFGEKMNELHKRKDACVSETPAVLYFTGSTPLANNSETDKLWHYRDPNGKIQGPFCMLQLRKWSTTGYFPHDMRVWSIINTEVDSLLLTDVLNGNFHKALPLRSKGSLPCQDVKSVSDGRLYNCEDRHSSSINPAVVNDGKRNNGSWNDSSATSLLQGRVHEDRRWNFGTNNGSWNLHGNTLYPTTGHENQSDSQRFSGQSSVESCRPLAVNVSSNNSDSNFSFASKAKSTDSSEHIKIDVLNLPSPTPPTSDRNLESQTSKDQKSSQSCGLVQGSGIEELPSPTPKMSDRDEKSDLDIQNLPISSPRTVDGDEKVDSTIQNSPISSPNPRDGSEKVHADESKPPGTSSTSASSLVVDGGAQLAKEADEWGGYSPTRTKPPEVASDQAASPASKCDQFVLPSQSDPPANTSHWQAIDYEPIEFSTLAEESVSDLLAEVDAMEAQGDLASPTSEMYSGDGFFEDSKGDCFASICGFSYPLDSGKSDAWSSTGDSSLPYQSAMKNEPLGPAENDVSDPIKRCNGESSTSTELGIEMRHTEVSVSQMETGPDSQIPSEPKPMNSGLEDVNPCVGGSSQGMTNVGWESNPGLAQGNVNINHDTSFGFMGHERIGAPSDWVGSPWIRQPPYGVGTDSSGGGVNYSRPPPKGQRVCKFYESGYCKKGAACNYLHP